MSFKGLRAAASVIALSGIACGCLVTGTTYETKSREADALREALAAASKEKNQFAAQAEALRKQLSDEKENAAALSARGAAQDQDIRRMSDELASARKNYEGTRITREQLISELLEKEKATGKRIQDLSVKGQALEAEVEKLRKEAADREVLVADLRRKAETTPEAASLRKERDILLGRVERLTDERSQEAKRRDDRLAALAEAAGSAAPGVTVASLGPALRIVVPERLLGRPSGTGDLPGPLKALIAEIGKAAGDLPSASVIVAAPAPKTAEEIQAALVGAGRFAPGRVLVNAGGRDKGAELLLLAP
ncbi:MAG: hypothetical protein ACM31I_09930 [Deltaproteobacteria bacterium]